MKYLGLDVGRKNIGIAVGQTLASELMTLRAPRDLDYYSTEGIDRAADEIAAVFDQEQCSAIVIGLPVDEIGKPTAESKAIKKFGEQIKKKLNRQVYYVNETLTSFMARDILESQGLKREEIEKREHRLAAQLILQQFIEENAPT